MSLVFAAITPHPPVLVPNIGKGNIKKLQATKEAMEQLEKDLYVAKPDTLIVISPHGFVYPDVFSANVHPQPQMDFKEFGDLATTGSYQTDMVMISQITEAAKTVRFPFVLQAEEKLDYGTAIPLLYLAAHLPKIKIISVSFSQLDLKKHLDFGYLLKEEAMNSGNRVAIIASADLSHRLTNDSPGGFSPAGQKFDDTVLQSLKVCNSTSLINMDPKLGEEAAECGLRSIIILLGALRNVNCGFKILSYESPLGVGYLTAEFAIK